MKTKKSKLTKEQELARQEVNHALALLHKHNISVIALDNADFADEWLKDQWKRVGIKPTETLLRQAKEKTLEYMQNEQGQMMHDAIENVAMRAKSFLKVIATNPKKHSK